ncbi:MAG: hypothetical protein L3J00_08165 [Thiomicrorhabdus sp.]|nr:hypothetical protein [Thiomicrorhabdus sp.]
MILPYKFETTNDLLTSRGGLLAIAQLMDSVNFAERSFHLDEIRHLQDAHRTEY